MPPPSAAAASPPPSPQSKDTEIDQQARQAVGLRSRAAADWAPRRGPWAPTGTVRHRGKIRNEQDLKNAAFARGLGFCGAESLEGQSLAAPIGANSRDVQRPSRRLERIVPDEAPHHGGVAGVECLDDRLGGLHKSLPLVTERAAAAMTDEEAGRRHVTPPRSRRPEAEVILLTVTATEPCLVEGTNLIDTGSPHGHAKADAGRDFHGRHIDRRT
ncbi:MAG: hypothetical protein FD144_5858 [Rhodospirillaceae bacterium]|nr:MAG: hypothetical protein FD144_5858 [Rhodospirillaceae bacterium]